MQPAEVPALEGYVFPGGVAAHAAKTAGGTMTTTRPISSILVGKRHRHDLGDIDQLAADIRDIGLINPVTITPDDRLICGGRRIEACKKLGFTEVPVRVLDIDAIVRGELAENALRKDFTPSEMVAISATIEEHERKLAKTRQVASLKRGDKKPVVEIFHDGGKVRDKMAAPLGVSGRTLEKAKAVVEAGKREPKKFGHLVAAMDKTGRVNAPYRRLKVAQQAEAIRAEPPPLPGNGPYRVINVDFPWPYEIASEESSIRGVWPYPTMSVSEMRNVDIPSIAHDDCILWMWTTNYHMQVVFDLLKHWGFQHRTILTWAKDRMGAGDWLRGQTEHALMAIRGHPIVTLTNQTTLLQAPLRAHSQKPPEFYDFVERLCPAPRFADLFSRYRHNDRWDCHGDQIGTLLGRASARGGR